MKTLIILFLIFISGALKADVVRVAFGEKLPPFIIPELNSGIQVEIVREALLVRGHVLKGVYLPMGRIPISFKDRKVDVAMLDVGEDMSIFGSHYGEPPILYDNVFITLKKNNLAIKKPEDLKNLRIMSFIGAQKRYPEWLGNLKINENYVEKNDQSVQPLLLDIGRYDAVLSDRYIFKYYSVQSKKNPRYKNFPVVEHSFTTADPGHYRPVFHDKKIRDDFNFGLKKIRKSGRVRAIYNSYLKS